MGNRSNKVIYYGPLEEEIFPPTEDATEAISGSNIQGTIKRLIKEKNRKPLLHMLR